MATQAEAVAERMQGMLSAIPEIPISENGTVVLRDMKAAYALAAITFESGWYPKGVDTPAKIAVTFLRAMRLRIDPFVALWNTAVINNRPTSYGDLPLGLCKAREKITCREWWEVQEGVPLERRPLYPSRDDYPDTLTACCEISDADGNVLALETFSVGDAKSFMTTQWHPTKRGEKITVALWDKEGPWQSVPWRMLVFRARTFALRNACPSTMMGLDVLEEVQDYDDDAPRTPEYSVQADDAEEAEPGAEEDLHEDRTDLLDEIASAVRASHLWDAQSFVEECHRQFGTPPRGTMKATLAALGRLEREHMGELLGDLLAMLQGQSQEGQPPAEDPEPEADPPAEDEPGEPEPEIEEAQPDEPITTGTKLDLLALVDSGKVARADFQCALAVFDVEKAAELTEAQGASILSSARRGVLLDDIERGAFDQ